MILKEIMNSIAYDMDFKTENQDEYDDGFMHTLDFKLRLETTNKIPRLRYQFFKKSVSSPIGILKTSALPEQIKPSTATQEIIRRLSNTDRSEALEVKNSILETYFESLRKSGYSESDRCNILNAAMNT